MRNISKFFVYFSFSFFFFNAFSNSKAGIYLTGTEGSGLNVYAFSYPKSDSENKSLPRGIVTYINDNISASASGTAGTASSSASLHYYNNANSLGYIDDITEAFFSISMTGGASRPACLINCPVNYAFMNSDFGISFIADSYYEYSIDYIFSNYYNKSTGYLLFEDNNTEYKLFSAKSDTMHTVDGQNIGIIAPGKYQLSSSIILSAFSPNYFDGNALKLELTLTPIPSPVPLPSSFILLIIGIAILFFSKNKFKSSNRGCATFLN